jgi:hypothetical protein
VSGAQPEETVHVSMLLRRWRDVAFVHWPVEPERIGALLPSGLVVDDVAVQTEQQLTGAVGAGAFADGDVTFIGTATVLVHYGGFTFLTDPNFLHQGQHAYRGWGLRSKRLTEPALDIDDLPALDFVVLSHHHGDHFDDVAAERLPKDVPMVTEPHAADVLARHGFTRAVALDTWSSHVLRRGDASVTVTATPGKHVPQPIAALLPPVTGSMVEFAEHGQTRFRTHIAGDTVMHDRLTEDPSAVPAHRPVPDPSRRDPHRRDPAHHGRRSGRAGAPADRSEGRHPDPLRRLRRVQVSARRVRGGGRSRRLEHPCGLPRPRHDVPLRRRGASVMARAVRRAPPTGPGLEEVVVAGAAARVARAISIDDIAAPLRDRLKRVADEDEGGRWTRQLARDLVCCRVCIGWWASLATSALWPGGNRVRRGVSVAGGQVLITRAERLVCEQGRLAVQQVEDG